jgi:NDP-sugar pyrophosphorylase family protein
MVTVAGRPILERLILHLMSHGIRNFFLAVNHLAHLVEDHFGDGARFGCRISYLRESVPLGTGGALSLIEDVPPDPLIVVNGDLLTQCDIGRLLEFHDGGCYGATIGVSPYSVDVPYGVVESEGDRLVSLAEKPSLRMMINAGVYVLSPQVAKLADRGRAQPITDLFAMCLERRIPVGVHTLEHEWLDVGRPEDLRRARGEQ